ncbi:MAG: hypothetical protein E2O85_02895 [Bacteroidetes bacterium]|nr:MAG: hypothetical protein E2O85_02895 [Bacteroidota bacterium]
MTKGAIKAVFGAAVKKFADTVWRLCVITILSCLLAEPAEAQDPVPSEHPLFSRPIQEADGSKWDIQHLRIHVFIDPVNHVLRGEAMFDLVVTDTTMEMIQFPTDAVSIGGISLFGSDIDSVDTSIDVSVLALSDPRPSDSLVGIRIDFDINRGLYTVPLGSSSGEWTAVWTSFEPGNRAWIPFDVSVEDWLTAELRVSVPIPWRVFLAGEQQWDIESDGYRTTASLFASSGPLRNLGFFAVKEEEITSEDRRFVVALLPDDSPPVNEARISISRMERFFTQNLGMGEPDSSRYILFPGPRTASSSGAGLSFLPFDDLPAGLHPAEEDFQLAKAVASRWVTTHLPLSGWTDIWMAEALPSYMAALYVQDRHGEDAFLHVMWNRRDEYLVESRMYLRPLVWDRWNHPGELLDAHATGKGIWVLHMLGEAHGTEFIWEALNDLALLGKAGTVSTEELRIVLENVLELDLIKYFDQWVYAAGHPILDYAYDVASNQESIELTIDQIQEGYLVPSEFSFEVEVESASLVGVDRDEFLIDERRSFLRLPVSLRPQYVLLDPAGKLLFEYGDSLEPTSIVSSLRRNTSVRSRYVGSRRLLSGEVDASMLIALRPILAERTSPYIDRNLLEGVSRMAPSSSALRELLSVAKDTTARTRAFAIQYLGLFPGSSDARRTAFEVANSESDPHMLAAAVSALVRLDSTLAWPVLRSALVTESTGDIVRRTAAQLLLDAPVGDDEKLDAFRVLLDKKYADDLRTDAIFSLQNWSDDRDVRKEILSLWAASSVQLRSSILSFFRSMVLSENERELILEWMDVEPDPLLHRLLKSTLR